MVTDKNLEGLGGWLILVGLGVILSPLLIMVRLFPMYVQVFENGAWGVLTTPGSTAYNPLWAPLIIAEMAINIGLVIAWVVAAILYFSKNKKFPKLYVGLFLFSLAFILADALATSMVLPSESAFDQETVQQFGRTLIASLIWIPYMLRSKRVKATFVR